jgi:tetratricopeptide (TPR) repeat protein
MKKKQDKKIKNQILKIKYPHQKSNIFEFLFIILILAFLFFNSISSQVISPLYFQFVNKNRQAVVDYLIKIKPLSEFKKILGMNKNIYGKGIENDIFNEEAERKQTIKNLEQLLTKNPKARDVLYRLYLLYKEGGNNLTAEKYLRQAKEVDPSMK